MCDTFVVLPENTENGSIIFGKNSDREPNEAQSVETHPAKDYPPGEPLECSYLTIPQVNHTHRILISRPFWMWGAEMGVNEHGVVIGNEAVFTRIPCHIKTGLTGMDLLRLALERTDTARSAMNMITHLIGEYNQGGNCGYTSNLFYHNSFILADYSEAWILETAGKYWAAKKVSGYQAISNRLSITRDFDLIHPEAISYAVARGWIKSTKDFNFAKCLSEPVYTRLTGSRTRLDTAQCLLKDTIGNFTISTAMAHLRSHGSDPYDPKGQPLMDSICAHSANPVTRHAAQTCNSMIVELKDGLMTIWTTMTAAPCTSVYKPLWLEAVPDQILKDTAAAHFSGDSLWWRHEKLHRAILLDYRRRITPVIDKFQAMEKKWMSRISPYMSSTEKMTLSTHAIEETRQTTGTLTEKLESEPKKRYPGIVYRSYWSRQNKAAGLLIR